MSDVSSRALPVAVITGAASGIGLETARRLVRTHRVAILDLHGALAEQAVASLAGTAVALHCDITDQDSVTTAVDSVIEHFGRIDVAISNAGIGAIGAARHLDPDVLAAQLDVNVTGNWRFMHACIPHLVVTNGYLLGVASAAAIISPPGEALYAASKAGLEALLNVVRVEVAHLGVDVGVAYLLFIDTPMVRDADTEHGDFARMRVLLPGPAGKSYPVSLAADTLARAVHRRSRRVFVPSSVRAQYVLRGVIGSLVDRQFRRIAPEVDRLTAQKVAERGAFEAGFTRAVLAGRDRQIDSAGGESDDRG
jgi:NAD(P)-dependent dehydrogenase (short-subunit alcohol dehydrogenase family)